jgi:uncharacterized protein YfiM (DUF2279 family)
MSKGKRPTTGAVPVLTAYFKTKINAMRLLLALLLMPVITDAQFRWDGKLDNNTLVHAGVGVATGNAIGIFTNTPKQRVVYGFLGAALVGLGKEVTDMNKGNQYGQIHDVLATAIGGAIGGVMVNWAVKRSNNYKAKEKIYKCKM